jgi:hypothetical protein
MPCGLTPIDVPDAGTWNEEVAIRLKRGRTVTLQAIGPNGERLPWVRASWQGRGAVHDSVPLISRLFPDGKVVIEGLGPGYTSRVFLLCNPAEVGAVFEITPQTGAGPIEVRLKPTGTVVGRTLTREGKPTGEAVAKLMISLDPDVSRFTKNRDLQTPYNYYWNFSRAREYGPDAAGEFAIECVVPGAPTGLQLGWSDGSGWTPEEIMTIEPLQPGERRDVGELAVGNTTQADTP